MTLWAVFSAFRPDERLLSAVTAAVDDVDGSVVVVDDGSGEGWEAIWAALERVGARVIRSSTNRGIGGALNIGLRRAFDADADAVVTFDQDSVIEPGFTAALQGAYTAASEHIRVGLVVPEFFAGVSQVRRRADGALYARHSIQSGMLVPKETMQAVGFLREDLFIDLVDTEYELRCHVHGLETIAAPGLTLGHSLGRQYARMAFGRRVRVPGIPDVVTLSSPFRYYYRVRNRRLVNRAYVRRAPGWIARDSLFELVHFANALLIARPRRALWRLYRAGWRDAGRGRTGAMPASLAPHADAIEWAAPEV